MRALATLLLTALSVTAVAQPSAPELLLTINEPDAVVGGRFEFTKIPELVFVRGIPQIVQLGFYQVDPATAGQRAMWTAPRSGCRGVRRAW